LRPGIGEAALGDRVLVVDCRPTPIFAVKPKRSVDIAGLLSRSGRFMGPASAESSAFNPTVKQASAWLDLVAAMLASPSLSGLGAISSVR
jgi:hypothetical protein